MDQDAESVGEVARCYGHFGVTTVRSSIRPLLTGRLQLGCFDLIYAAGLYDYLKQETAARLTEGMFELLRSGGRLIVSNFISDITAAGYMESLMDWWLIYRSEVNLRSLVHGIDFSRIASQSSFVEENRNIAFMTLQKA